MPEQRDPPIVIQPLCPSSDPSNSAAIIFIHGLGDTAEGIESIPRQFQSAGKLPHLTWILPNAQCIHDIGTTAWYMPTRLSPYKPSRPELEDPEDEAGILDTIAYISSLIENLIERGIPPSRIVLGGFSQGHAIALLTGLIDSKYAGMLAGCVGLSGYLPLVGRIEELRQARNLGKDAGNADETEFFLARGTADRLVPRRYHRIGLESLDALGVHREKVTVAEYEGMGHVMGGQELRDLCAWLERVLPGFDEREGSKQG